MVTRVLISGQRDTAQFATEGSAHFMALPTLAMQVDFVGETVIYHGWAEVGTGTDSALWRLRRVTFTDEDVAVEWADGDVRFDNVWDNRASLSYS